MVGGGRLLDVRDLSVEFDTEGGTVRAVDDLSFSVDRGEVLAIVGESGCGKTATSLAILRLLPEPAGTIASGTVDFDGIDLTALSRHEMRKIRGDRVAMIFQDALTALNPVYRIGDQIVESIRTHRDMSKAAARRRAVELLELVGIPHAADRADDYVHQFSGGMRQRAMIAMAISLEPDLLIADEPTTALDVTVQAQVLEVLSEVRDRLGMSILLITHDLGVVARMADRVMVMYAGRKAEEGPIDAVFDHPRHPYTWGLKDSIPRADMSRDDKLRQIPGAPPNLLHPPPGCRFAPRCRWVQDQCRHDTPDARAIEGTPLAVACHFAARDDWSSELDPGELTRRLAAGAGGSR